jgi:N-acetylglucosaminyldiphosphoundecaprenol N-acetyl-beta-D-mannosaminyltransferase
MKVNLLGAPIDALSMDDTVERVEAFLAGDRPRRVITLNPELLYRMQTERHLWDLVSRADLITPDGIGIVWACRVAGQPVPERVTGIDLMLRLVERAARDSRRVFLLGAAPGVADEAAERLTRRYPGLAMAGTHHGYFQPGEEENVFRLVRRARAEILFVALGAPKQEIWIDRYLQVTGVRVAMGVGGSLDVLAGRARRAPEWSQRLHLEWLARLVMEPARLKRQTVLPRFAWLVLKTYRLGRSR